MKMSLYTIYDKIACQSMPPWLAKNDEAAKRSYRLGLEEANKSPAEYKLLKLGVYELDDPVSLEALGIPEEVE